MIFVDLNRESRFYPTRVVLFVGFHSVDITFASLEFDLEVLRRQLLSNDAEICEVKLWITFE